MTTVLDQYEVEYKETYISGTYDQVVMGRILRETRDRFGKRVLVAGNRGVVYGSINSNQAPIPGTGIFDRSNSISYRLQPYKEKAGNCRAVKIICDQERIYDTLAPNPIACFKLNGANVFAIANGSPYVSPGNHIFTSGVDTMGPAWIMFDSYIPDENIQTLPNGTKVWNGITGSINPGVDKHWTKSFPFEPRYSSVKRERSQNFSNIETNLIAAFAEDPGIPTQKASFSNSRIKQRKTGLLIGTFGPRDVSKHNLRPDFLSSGSFFHRWAADVNLGRLAPGTPGPFTAAGLPVTGSHTSDDTIKILFGFGDAITTHYATSSILSDEDSTGYGRRGTNNWPEFRLINSTRNANYGVYNSNTGSLWTTSPIIRGWKYGLYNGLPDYSAVYYRQGRYGQYRDMLEQRLYTRFFYDDKTKIVLSRSEVDDGPVTVKFFDENQNLTDAQRTMSQNLSQFATSSLPYFDLQQRNTSDVNIPSNLTLVGFSVDNAGNVTI